MFKLMSSPAYWWPVTLREQAENDPGKFVETVVEVQFIREGADAQKARLDAVRTNGLLDAAYVTGGLVTGWRKVLAPDNTEVPFSAEALAQFVKLPGVATEIVLAYFKSNDLAAQKN